MKWKVVAVIAVIAIVIAVPLYSYFSYFSSPFNTKWKANIGYSITGISLGTAHGSGNFYAMGLYGSFYTEKEPFKIMAFNSTNGNSEWTLPLQLSLSNWNWMGGPISISIGNFPQIFFSGNCLYLTAYFQNYSIGSYSGNLTSQTNALIAQISPSSGAVLSIKTLDYNFSHRNSTLLEPFVEGNAAYFSYVSISGGQLATHIVAANLADSNILWNASISTSSHGTSFPSAEEYLSQDYIAVVTGMNGTGSLFSISKSTGQEVANYSMNGFIDLGGVAGNSFVYGTTSSGKLNLNIANLSGSGVTNVSTPVSYTNLSTPIVSTAGNDILVSLNSMVYAYSTNGLILWKERIQHANANYYQSGFLAYGKEKLLYWSAVSVFTGVHGPVNYRVTYNYFAVLNATSGHTYWDRSYAPATSTFLNYPGSSLYPAKIYGNQILYEWYGNSGTVIAVANL